MSGSWQRQVQARRRIGQEQVCSMRGGSLLEAKCLTLLLLLSLAAISAKEHKVDSSGFTSSIFDDGEGRVDDAPPPAYDWHDDAPSLQSLSRSVALVKDEGDGKLAPDERGLALLRSPALANKALRIIGVVGQARTGKSFFMNSLVGKARTFEVSSGDEGFTKGLWLHQLDHPSFSPPSTASGDAARSAEQRSSAEHVEQQRDHAVAEEEDSVDAGEDDGIATILIDSEGLGAPGGSKVYDTKMVALTAMLSSTTFYNNMRKVNKMDVEFLGDVVLFDEVFRSLTTQPLLVSSIVWLVQSYSSKDECQDYPSRFLRKLGAAADEELRMHDRVIDYVETRCENKTIFCLPYPKTEPYTPEAELHMLDYAELDQTYRMLVDDVRNFIATVPLKQGSNSDPDWYCTFARSRARP